MHYGWLVSTFTFIHVLPVSTFIHAITCVLPVFAVYTMKIVIYILSFLKVSTLRIVFVLKTLRLKHSRFHVNKMRICKEIFAFSA